MTQDTRISSDQDVATASFPNIVAFLRTLKGYPDKVVETAALEAAQALSVLQARVGEVEKERDALRDLVPTPLNTWGARRYEVDYERSGPGATPRWCLGLNGVGHVPLGWFYRKADAERVVADHARARAAEAHTAAAQALSVLQARVGEVEKERDGLRAMIEGREQLASLGIDGHGTAVEVAKKFMRDRDAAEARAQAAEARLAEAREALREAYGLTTIMLGSPFWKEAVEPVRAEVARVSLMLSAALSRLNGEG